MTGISYSDVFGIELDRHHHESIRPGDVVYAGSNHFPHFEVIALDGGTAWVRDVQTAANHLVQVARIRRVEVPALAIAA